VWRSGDVVKAGVGDGADQVTPEVAAVELGKMPLDPPRGKAPPVQGEDLVVEALKPPLALAHQLRLEASPPVPGRLDLDRAVLSRNRLGRRAVAGVADTARRLPASLGAEILRPLRLQRPLAHPLRHPADPPARPDVLLLAPSARKQLVDPPLRQPLPHLLPQLRRRRAAGRSLRSPSGLAPQPAGAIGAQSLRLIDLRGHDAPPFRSCLHSRSDTPMPAAVQWQAAGLARSGLWRNVSGGAGDDVERGELVPPGRDGWGDRSSLV